MTTAPTRPAVLRAREWYERAVVSDPRNRPALLNLSALDLRASYGDKEFGGLPERPAAERARRRLRELRRLPRGRRDAVWIRATYLLLADTANRYAASTQRVRDLLDSKSEALQEEVAALERAQEEAGARHDDAVGAAHSAKGERDAIDAELREAERSLAELEAQSGAAHPPTGDRADSGIGAARSAVERLERALADAQSALDEARRAEEALRVQRDQVGLQREVTAEALDAATRDRNHLAEATSRIGLAPPDRELAEMTGLAVALGRQVEWDLLAGSRARRSFARDIEPTALLAAACAFELCRPSSPKQLETALDVAPRVRRWWDAVVLRSRLKRLDASRVVRHVTSWTPLPARATYNLACFWSQAGTSPGEHDDVALRLLAQAIDDGSAQLAALAATDPYFDQLRIREPEAFGEVLSRRRPVGAEGEEESAGSLLGDPASDWTPPEDQFEALRRLFLDVHEREGWSLRPPMPIGIGRFGELWVRGQALDERRVQLWVEGLTEEVQTRYLAELLQGQGLDPQWDEMLGRWTLSVTIWVEDAGGPLSSPPLIRFLQTVEHVARRR